VSRPHARTMMATGAALLSFPRLGPAAAHTGGAAGAATSQEGSAPSG